MFVSEMNPYDPLTTLPRSCRATRTSRTSRNAPKLSASRIASCDHAECENKARRKLLDWGFDPDDVSKSTSSWHASRLRPASNINYGARDSTPMIIFSQLGDFRMMKYVLAKSHADRGSGPGGELTRTDEHGLFPLYVAISKPHSEVQILAMCQWMHRNGADIKQTVGGQWSALSRACIFEYEEVAKWLISAGALLDANGNFDPHIAKRDIPSCGYDPQTTADPLHQRLFAWAHDVVRERTNFLLFLSGTLQPDNKGVDPRKTVERMMVSRGYYSADAVSFLLRDISDSKLGAFLEMAVSPLVVFGGHPGVLELISQYCGVEMNGVVLKSARGLIQHKRWWNLRKPFFCLVT